jgi:purine-binding chemotaxis protein CheW
VTRQKRPDSDIESPEESLSHYFDDLLGIGDLLDEAFTLAESRSVPVAVNAGVARVVSLPSKKTAPEKSKTSATAVANDGLNKTPLVSRPEHNSGSSQKRRPEQKLAGKATEKATRKPREYAEPELVQTPEQKRQLEKLLQSASAQLMVEAPAVDALKIEAQVEIKVESKVEVKVETIAPPVTETSTRLATIVEEIQEWDIETYVDESTLVATPDIIVAPDEPSAPPFKMDGLEWLENGRPQWAQTRFDVLLFKVAGLTLAVPLISLGQIQPLTDELTPLFGQADWFMGLQPTPAGKIRTVNTAKFVMPERYDDSFLQTAKYVMSIDGVPWGLAVDSVNQPITLQPEDVKWRGDRGKRPWLAGTVKDHMCALLDIPRIGQMLVEADKNFMSV